MLKLTITGKRIKGNGRIGSESNIQQNLLSVDINQGIERNMKEFVFQIVTASNFRGIEKKGYPPGLFPVNALIRDKKFMETLGWIKEEFISGCKNFYP